MLDRSQFNDRVTFKTAIELNGVGDVSRKPVDLSNSSGTPLVDLNGRLVSKGTAIRPYSGFKGILEQARLIVLECCDTVSLGSLLFVNGCKYTIKTIVSIGIVSVFEIDNAT